MEEENSKTESHVVSLEVLDLEEKKMVELPFVLTRPKLPVSTENIASQDDINQWPHPAGIIGLLIGYDASDVLEPKEIRQSRNSGPYATRTIFGWVVNGPLGQPRSSPTDLQLHEQFQKYCDMALPWLSDPPCLENNQSVAELQKYRENVENSLKEGCAFRAQTTQAPGQMLYLSHHPAFPPCQTRKDSRRV